jgi:hypothetical protein
MSRKRYTPEQIISILREAEVALAQGSVPRTVASALGDRRVKGGATGVRLSIRCAAET